ncbi:hypothetical protein SBA5_1050003 [Candidatus Sulfotelmatomonas gaucii]|uniref:Uncharacterized protein n=1 Tax=Candidatus Sulfuritelmatomonas gaucii TaxID=2043161 RepID=A0A2N9L2P2_9BACT|nr:hypothetical protein SBA5_1050003 [Candidatus Sulfotelmatomonas gaucii]
MVLGGAIGAPLTATVSEHCCDGGHKYDAGCKRQDFDGVKVRHVVAEMLFDLLTHDRCFLFATNVGFSSLLHLH